MSGGLCDCHSWDAPDLEEANDTAEHLTGHTTIPKNKELFHPKGQLFQGWDPLLGDSRFWSGCHIFPPSLVSLSLDIPAGFLKTPYISISNPLSKLYKNISSICLWYSVWTLIDYSNCTIVPENENWRLYSRVVLTTYLVRLQITNFAEVNGKPAFSFSCWLCTGKEYSCVRFQLRAVKVNSTISSWASCSICAEEFKYEIDLGPLTSQVKAQEENQIQWVFFK